MTDNRNQFTFYKSYLDAIEELPAKQQLPILKAIIRYALFGEDPDNLPSVCRAVFLLVKPTLDASRKKAANGKLGGKSEKANCKQTESKQQANSKQTASEKEKEDKKENEIEGENNKRSNTEATPAPNSGKSFTSFWEAYPSKIGREAAWESWKALNPDANTVAGILSGLDAWKASEQWTEEGGRYVPRAAKFLSERHWESPPKEFVKKGTVPYGASGKLGPEEVEAIHRILTEPDYGLRKSGEVVSE